MRHFFILLTFLYITSIDAKLSFSDAKAKLATLEEDVKTNKIDIPNAILSIEEMDIELLLKASVEEGDDSPAFSGHVACTGAATGIACFNSKDLPEYKKLYKSVIWVTDKINNDDLCYIQYVDGICALEEDPSSHAIIVTRINDVPCITLLEDAALTTEGLQTKEGLIKDGQTITVDAFNGLGYNKEISILQPKEKPLLDTIANWTRQYTTLSIHGNADTVEEAKASLYYGAKGVDPRSEHMFFNPDSLKVFRKVILQKDNAAEALDELKEIQKKDILELYQTMGQLPVKLRLLDPPLHEFLPTDPSTCQELALELGITVEALKTKIAVLSEDNPMMGHRGVRLLLTFPEILETQARAIFEAAADPSLEGKGVKPVIIVPMIVSESEIIEIKNSLNAILQKVNQELSTNIDYKLGVMIETPRACFFAKEIAKHVDYFSFGTNDLTGLTFAFSRGDVFDKFLKHYLENDLLELDPFMYLDPAVEALMNITVQNARLADHYVSIGICGEHASQKIGVFACHKLGLDSVSCAPERIPVVQLFAAQAEILFPRKGSF